MSTPNPKHTPKSAKKSRIVTLHIAPRFLESFATPQASTSDDRSTPAAKPEPSPSAQPAALTDKSSESNETPVPTVTDEAAEADPSTPVPDGKKKKVGGSLSGRKRAPPAIDPNAPPKERGRPGPKKKPRLPDGTIDRSAEGKKGPVAGPVPTVAAHKLGPKANTGAINAGLRALDRSGKPCRKWERKTLQLKSFTGMNWDMSSWKAPLRDAGFAGDVKSDSNGSSELKPHGSSVAPSDRSHAAADNGDTTMMMTGIESSPAPAVPV